MVSAGRFWRPVRLHHTCVHTPTHALAWCTQMPFEGEPCSISQTEAEAKIPQLLRGRTGFELQPPDPTLAPPTASYCFLQTPQARSLWLLPRNPPTPTHPRLLLRSHPRPPAEAGAGISIPKTPICPDSSSRELGGGGRSGRLLGGGGGGGPEGKKSARAEGPCCLVVGGGLRGHFLVSGWSWGHAVTVRPQRSHRQPHRRARGL